MSKLFNKLLNFNELLTIGQFAAACNVSRQTVYNWLKSNNPPSHELIGGKHFFYRSDIEEYKRRPRRKTALRRDATMV